MVERDKVDIVLGPFAAFELLATVDYLAQAKMPTLAFAGAEDVTQRKAGAYLTRTSYTSAQCLYPLADYVFNEMKLKRAASMGDDFAFGYEQVGGFQRVSGRPRGSGREKTLVAAQHRGLCALCRANPRLRRCLRSARRFKPAEVYETGARAWHETAAGRRLRPWPMTPSSARMTRAPKA